MKDKFIVGNQEIEITPMPEGADPVQWLQQMIDDCPDCQAARARGEEPVALDVHDLDALLGKPTRKRKQTR